MNKPKRDYRDTLFLPATDFPMRAGLPKKEPEWLDYWKKIKLYKKLREASSDKPQWTLHDGPPYANGHIHIGTAMNCIEQNSCDILFQFVWNMYIYTFMEIDKIFIANFTKFFTVLCFP